MEHIRNSVKGVFFLENFGVPTSLLTNYNEPIINGSLCVDRTNEELYILKSSLWVKIGGNAGAASTSGIQPIIETTYTQLETDVSNLELIPGQLYQFDFQTIHQIPGTSDINIGTTEKLIVRALSGSNFHAEVYSLDFPSDIIEYDFTDNLVEDAITSRKGKITYRKDTVNNLETYYDFRNVKFRRFDISTSLNDTWSASTYIAEDDAIIFGDHLYKCGQSHTSGVSFEEENFVLLFENISSHSYLWNSASVVLGNTVVFADTTFNNYLTFEATAENVHVGRYNTYNNIVFNSTNGASNINIGDDSYDMNILGSSLNIAESCNSISIGNNCYEIDLAKNVSHTSIVKDSNNVRIDSNSYQIAMCQCDQISIGSNNNNLSLSNIKHSIFGDSNTNIYALDNGDNLSLETFNYDIRFGSDNSNISIASNGSNFDFGASVSSVDIGNSNGNITIGDNTSIVNIGLSNFTIDIGTSCIDLIISSDTGNVTIGNNVSRVKMGDWCDTITLNNSCSDILIDMYATNIVFGTSNAYIKMGSNCTNITFPNAVTNNIFEANCSAITLQTGAANNYFTTNVKNKTFNSATSGLKFLISDTNSKTYSNSFTNAVANMIDSNNDIWYQTIDTLGSITTVKMS